MNSEISVVEKVYVCCANCDVSQKRLGQKTLHMNTLAMRNIFYLNRYY